MNTSTGILDGKKRSAAIDMVKGLSIMTLFFLHFERGWIDTQYNFFIVRSPAFFIVVGWLWGMSSNKRTLKEHWQKRKQGLVIPYLWLSLIFIIFDVVMILLNWHEPFILWRDIYKTLCFRGIGTLWFLPALLFGELLFIYTRDRAWRLKSVYYLISLTLICCYSFWRVYYNGPHMDIINAPLRVIKDSCDAFIYISAAYYFSSNFGKMIIGQKRSMLFLIGVVLLSIDFYLINFISLPLPWYDINSILGGVMAGFGILFLFTSIEDFKPIANSLVYCGKNSLIIMAFHFCLLLPLFLIFDQRVMGNAEFTGFRTVIYFLTAVVLQVMIIELINKKMRFIIGKS